ncbi:MAG: hypothetical protein H6868_08775 [Rhodospirillales bacterium]|nr:hypothetical protein [Rhodospirillales bacterium]
MDKFEYSLIFFGLYIAGLAWVSWKSRYHDHGSGFIIGNRDLGFWSIYGSIVSYLRSGSAFIFWFSFAALMGFGSIWIIVAFLCAFALMAFLAPQAQKLAGEHNYITLPDLITDRQGPLMALSIKILSLYASIITTTAQLFVAGNIIGGLLNVGTVTGTIIGAFIVGTYIVLGGFLSVVRTDIYQAGIMILLAVGTLLFGTWPETPVLLDQITHPDFNWVVGGLVLGLTIPANADLWQRYFAAKTPTVGRNATIAALFTDVVLVGGIILFALNMLALAPGADPQNVFNDLFRNSIAHPAIIALFGVFVISAMLSTLDNQVFNFTSIVTKNVLNINIETDRPRFIRVLRILTIVMLATLTALSLTIENLLQWIMNTWGFMGIATPVIFYAFLKRGHNRWTDKILATGVLCAALVYWILFVITEYSAMIWYLVPYCAPLPFIAIDLIINRKTSLPAPA